ncbi:molybdenum cofactor biosynthesis protein,putative [Trypanosoma brucei gambiense DAL972]|uniref:Molybdenum cofactor biosynthesis protein,putative n=1 Tax=Trypanosoma brucei gambiense (strain MHOM/CI/86/DAL972) TaxID=679716 RepID=D0A968_TRYB9|nr:molybdenum cofactor biosynthesis protein,putative [Trypanosoma brucei gambiense DAL972]CBH18219.1 molybdenum cofactor biosynthesis protein,putative [Trypanosoma brucei gambiense DAL972]|eukprot:XP_011780483.1 molybdenum cofactor biosynthesis protein,putative [Trypanosoma brucei gambiense DAL972]
MLRLVLTLLAKKKVPPPPKRGRPATPQRGKSKLVPKGRSPSLTRKVTPKVVSRQSPAKKSTIKVSTARVSRRSDNKGRGSKLIDDVDSFPVAAAVEHAPAVVPSVEVAATSTAMTVTRKPHYSLATAVSTVIVPPCANAVLETMKQTLSPSVRSPSEAGVDLCGDGSGVEQGGEPPSQMEEFYTPKKGPLFATAVIAGTNAVKQTSQLIPFCHPARIHKCSFTFRRRVLGGLTRISSLPHRVVLRKRATPSPHSSRNRPECSVIYCFCTVATDDETRSGVEMEALAGATMAALTMYDMLRALPSAQEDGISVGEAFVLAKRGSRGDFTKLLVSELPAEDSAGAMGEVRRAALTTGREDNASEDNFTYADDYENLSGGEGLETGVEEHMKVGTLQTSGSRCGGLDDGEHQSEEFHGAADAIDGDAARRERQRERDAILGEAEEMEAEGSVTNPEEEERAMPEEAATLIDRSAWWRSTARDRRLQHLQQNMRHEGNSNRSAPQAPAHKSPEVRPPMQKDAMKKLGVKNKPQELPFQRPKIIPVSKKSVKLVDKNGGIAVPKGQRVVVVEDEYYEENGDEAHADDEIYGGDDSEYEELYNDDDALGDETALESEAQHKKLLRYKSGESVRAQTTSRGAVSVHKKGRDYRDNDSYNDENASEDGLFEEEMEMGSRQKVKKGKIVQTLLSRRGNARATDDSYDHDNQSVTSPKHESWDAEEAKEWESEEDDWSNINMHNETESVAKGHLHPKRRNPLPLPKKKEMKFKKTIKQKQRPEKR